MTKRKAEEIILEPNSKKFCFFSSSELILTKALSKKLIDYCKNIISKADLIQFFTVANNILLLIKLAETSNSFAAFCRSDMHDYWQKEWAQLGRYPTKEEIEENAQLKYRPLKPQPGISCFDLVRGMTYFDHALLLEKREINGELQEKCLNKAIEAKSFHAVFFLVRRDIKLMTSGHFPQKNPLNMLKLLDDLIVPHGLPIFLLIAEYHLALSKYHFENRMQPVAERIALPLKTAFKYLVAAQDSEAICQESTWNAYYGLGLQVSNPFGINTLSEMRAQLLNHLSLGQTDEIQLTQEGKNIAREFKIQLAASTLDNIAEDTSTITKHSLQF